MIIKNIQVFQADGSFIPGELYIKGSKITVWKSQPERDARETQAVHTAWEDVLDGNGAYAIPGLTDLHFHGCKGYDLCDGTLEALEAMAAYQAKNGVTQICPASMTLPESDLAAVAGAARAFALCQETARPGQAVLVGLNMEGPFLSREKKGAQNPLYLKNPDIPMFRRLQKQAGGLFRLVTVAPEAKGALSFIQALREEVVISLGHTTADYETSANALKAGASHITHLYNAMPPFSHREPGVIGAAFDDPGCFVELICDGVHVAPSVVRAAFRLFGDHRIVLISDSMRAAGMTDGVYSLGGQSVHVRGPLATLPDGTIAGSVTCLMDCLRKAVKDMGIPLGSAVRCAAVNPARSLGICDRFGSLTPGRDANIVLLDKDLKLQSVILQGKLL